MKKTQNNYGIASWKIDSPIERFLSKMADRGSVGKWLYVNYYRIFDKNYFDKGLKFIDNNIKIFVGNITQKQRKWYIYDMVYSLHRFGCMFDEYFLFDFENLNTKGRENTFITDKVRWEYYAKMNLEENKELFNNKQKAYDLFKNYYKRELVAINDETNKPIFDNFIKKHSRFIVKPIDGSGGKGIYITGIDEYNDIDSLFNKLLENGPVVLEELIKQSAEMEAINASSVNTVRVPTIKTKDKTIIFHPFLRSGKGNSCVDNAASGGILCPVDPDTGLCVTAGVDEFGNKYLYHPISHITYPGFQIPRWSEAVDLAKELSTVVKDNHYVGWDLALTDDKGWVMVEGNPCGQFVEQFATKCGIKKELDNYIRQM